MKSVALAACLVAGGGLMAVAVQSDYGRWFGWFSLLPLFWAIRVCRPVEATLAGALWGTALCVFSWMGAAAPVEPTVRSLVFLAAVPACYAYLGVRLTAWVGFSPFVLGVGWMGVEFALAPLGLHTGLLAATQGSGLLIDLVGKTLGYVLVAFLVAYVNAWLTALAGDFLAAISTERRVLVGPGDPWESQFPSISQYLPQLAIQAARPRAPPVW